MFSIESLTEDFQIVLFENLISYLGVIFRGPVYPDPEQSEVGVGRDRVGHRLPHRRPRGHLPRVSSSRQDTGRGEGGGETTHEGIFTQISPTFFFF